MSPACLARQADAAALSPDPDVEPLDVELFEVEPSDEPSELFEDEPSELFEDEPSELFEDVAPSDVFGDFSDDESDESDFDESDFDVVERLSVL